jgi:hypothetical protein
MYYLHLCQPSNFPLSVATWLAFPLAAPARPHQPLQLLTCSRGSRPDLFLVVVPTLQQPKISVYFIDKSLPVILVQFSKRPVLRDLSRHFHLYSRRLLFFVGHLLTLWPGSPHLPQSPAPTSMARSAARSTDSLTPADQLPTDL